MVIQISPMIETDLTAIKNIEKISFRFPWSEKMFLEELCSPNSLCRVARIQETTMIVGYLICRIYAGEAHLYNLAINQSFRRHGFAGFLLEDMADISRASSADTLFLEVGVSNEAAVKLYEKHGFRRIGIRKNYYIEAGENALLMSKKLKEDAGNRKLST